MQTPPEEFDALRKLLALKRHEQPPPGYFNQFSFKVVARIQAGESAADESWLDRFLARFRVGTAMAGAIGVAAVVVVVGAVLVRQQPVPSGGGQTARDVIVSPAIGSNASVTVAASTPRDTNTLHGSNTAPSGLFAPGAEVERAGFEPKK
jgi:hypothetical protein